ncbi:MAG: hypothetical protein COZ96_03520, partial [Nitrospirae bacterium CG_4_8_14_3_um_filter_70_85]
APMISLALSLSLFAAALGVTVALHGYVGYGIAAGILLFLASNFVLARAIGKRMEAQMRAVGDLLGKGQTERAVALLKATYPLTRWQFLLRGQVDGQIGVILYAQRKFDEALPYLEKSSNRHWMARAMLAVTYLRKKQIEAMDQVFKKAIAANRKEGMLASLYAYCLLKLGRPDEAQVVLLEGLKKLAGDARLEANLKAIQNRKPIKMKSYGDLWYQFHLERPAGALMGQQPRGPQPHIRRKMLRR